TYDGNSKEAKVTSDKEGIGAITINYYNSVGTKLDSAPKDAGTYKVKIDVTDGDNYNAGTDITANDWTFTIEKATPQASDFAFRRPSSLTYDGKGKVATVTSDKEGIGTITIKYCKEGSDSWTGTAPINVGTYKVKIDVADGDNYNAGTDITANDWTFTIGYLNDEDLKCIISGPAYEDDNTYWLRDDDTAEINPPEGYKISTSEDSGDGNWKDSLTSIKTWDKEIEKIYLRNEETDEITDEIKILKDIKQDSVAPNGSIKLNNRTPWESFINLITFGLFFKDKQQTVTITATDIESGIKEAKYLVSNSDLIQKENATPEEIATILDGQTGWATFAGSSTDIVLEEDNKYVVYEKITDNVGHVTYISSDGIVVYSDSTTDTDTVSYPKTTKKDIEVKITTNCNTIKGIKIDSGELDEKNYEVSAEDEDKKSTITFKGLYLDTLSAGSHQLIISYNPQGESYVNGTSEGDEPEETQIELFVQTLNIDTDEDGKADINIDTDGDGKADINIDTDGDGKADINIDTDGDGKADINIDTDGDGKADINIDTDGDGKADI
ncbi:MAG: MBG domain-containing protein, partial [Acutalibacteraceae bacterium]